MSISGMVIIAVVVVLLFYVVSIYNKLVALKNIYQNAFSQIEVQLKRRYDLIPNLVEAVKAYMTHERETLEAVIAARNTALAGLKAAAANPSSVQAMSQLAGAEGMLASALGKLNVVMEAYPELKANQNMAQLTEEMTSTENKIAFARQGFNDSVMAYNNFRQSFPPVMFANIFGHSANAKLLTFENSQAIQTAPKVSFD